MGCTAHGGYVGITRAWVGPKDERVRAVLRTESADFVHWSEGVEVFRGAHAHDQINSMPDWDTADTELAWSPDTITWSRACPGQPLIPRGEGSYPVGAYDCGCVYAAAPLLIGDAMYIYYGGSNGLHNGFREGLFCLATLPRERFAGYSAGSAPGRLTTGPLVLGTGGIGISVGGVSTEWPIHPLFSTGVDKIWGTRALVNSDCRRKKGAGLSNQGTSS